MPDALQRQEVVERLRSNLRAVAIGCGAVLVCALTSLGCAGVEASGSGAKSTSNDANPAANDGDPALAGPVVTVEVPVAAGSALAPTPSTTAIPSAVLLDGPLRWNDDIEQARQQAGKEGRLLVIFARADWAMNARVMERVHWNHQDVRALLGPLVLARLDLTSTSSAMQELADRMRVKVVPTVVVERVARDAQRRSAGPLVEDQVIHEGELSGTQLADFLREALATLGEPR